MGATVQYSYTLLSSMMATPIAHKPVRICIEMAIKKPYGTVCVHIHYTTVENEYKSSNNITVAPYFLYFWAKQTAKRNVLFCSYGVVFVFKKVAALSLFFGSCSRVQNRLARGSARKPWAALRAAPTSRKMECVYNTARTYFIKNS